MSQTESGYNPDLVGKRVRHNCDDPHCTLQGTIIDLVPNPDKVVRGEHTEWLAVVKFDPHETLPEDYTQPVSLSMVKVIEDG